MEDKNKAQEILMEIRILLQVESASDANKLLNEGCILLSLTEGVDEFSIPYSNYTLGFTGEESKLSDWARDHISR